MLSDSAYYTINMPVKLWANPLPHWVKHEVNAFSSRMLCRRDEIAITRNQDYL